MGKYIVFFSSQNFKTLIALSSLLTIYFFHYRHFCRRQKNRSSLLNDCQKPVAIVRLVLRWGRQPARRYDFRFYCAF